MSDIELELHVDGALTAGAYGAREEAYAEMRRYWAQYCNDGTCSVYEVTRKQIPIVDLLGLGQETITGLADRQVELPPVANRVLNDNLSALYRKGHPDDRSGASSGMTRPCHRCGKPIVCSTPAMIAATIVYCDIICAD